MGGYDAIILSGGRARRLGGADKASLVVDGSALISRAVAAVEAAERVIVVGPQPSADLAREVIVTREEPAGGGPVAAIAAGLDHVTAPITVVLAVDVPRAGQALPELLAALTPRAEAAIGVDSEGFRQPLCAAYRTDSLRREITFDETAGRSMKSVLEGMVVAEVGSGAGDDGAGDGGEAFLDIDTPHDLARLLPETLIEPPWDQARAAAYASGHALRVETVALADADGGHLAEPVLALTDLPAFDTSAMDGWAVCGSGPWTQVGQVLAGSVFDRALAPGECVRIATGAAAPTGTTGIIRQERAHVGPSGIVSAESATATDLRPRGEEALAGDVLIPAGTRVGPAQIGMAAAAGHDTLDIRRQPTATLLILGDELLHSGLPGDGKVRDSLGPQLPGWLRRLGVNVVGTHFVEDTLEAHVAAIDGALTDLVITTGGTAAGPVDHLHRAIEEVRGVLVVDSVACRPGHPQLLARLGPDRWLLGLPGNPQSAVVGLLTLGAPLIARLADAEVPMLERTRAGVDIPGPQRETRLVLATLSGGEAFPLPHLGSGMLRGVAHAEGFAVLPPGGVRAGGEVRWLPLPV